ncbi:MAG TPA: hypothetical protein VNE61_08670 [Ktedonobacteraceae bacterium]|nr:hypothetical protein [Ktedonobacteraceae bacterium]
MPMQRTLYPKNWRSIAAAHKTAVGNTCQRCGKRHGDLTRNRFGKPVRVVLTVAHLDHDPDNPNARLVVWCTQCHLRYDASHAQRFRKAARMAMARGQLALFAESEVSGMSP